jgi:hypothetical protein
MPEVLLTSLAATYLLIGFYHCCVALAWIMDPAFPGETPEAMFVAVLGVLSIPGWPILHLVAAGYGG